MVRERVVGFQGSHAVTSELLLGRSLLCDVLRVSSSTCYRRTFLLSPLCNMEVTRLLLETGRHGTRSSGRCWVSLGPGSAMPGGKAIPNVRVPALLLHTEVPKRLETGGSGSSCTRLTVAGARQHLQANPDSRSHRCSSRSPWPSPLNPDPRRSS